MSARFAALTLVAAVSLLAPQTVSADDAPEKTIRYRHKVMDALGDHMGATSMILKGEINRPQDLATHAQTMHELSKTLPELWPKGTLDGSESKKEVWEKWDDFLAACKTFEEATAALSAAAKKPDLEATKAAFQKVGGSCGGCHDSFRVDDDG